MSYNFDRIKHKVEHGTGHQWTSYSDLFLVLSVTFLLLYVVANLRSSAAALFTNGKTADQELRIAELEKQLKAYEVLKDDYIEKGASRDEIDMYRDLESQLSLLEKEAKSEFDEATRKAREAKVKFNGLNKYQSLVKNIINANMVSAAKSKRQMVMLDDRERTIETQDASIRELETETAQQQSTIERNSAEISRIQRGLAEKEDALRKTRTASREERKKLEESLARERAEGQAKISALSAESAKASAKISEMETELAERSRQAERLMTEMQAKTQEHESAINNLRAEHDRRAKAERAQYEGQLKSARLTAAQKAAAEKALRDRLAQSERELGQKIANLDGELGAAKRGLQEAEEKYGSSIKALQKANDGLKSDLNSSLEKLNAQRKVAQAIKENLRKAGVKATVDEKSGDVTVSFGEEYFDTNRAELKPGMRETLQRTIPAYANSLFADPELAKKIDNVEIVGFASPTFQGRVVDPQSMDQRDRAAINYNMDLSYRRARTIFDYIFDQKHIKFDKQKQLLPLAKVSGRSYLTAQRMPSASNSVKETDYCKNFDCKQHQIVVIKFNLKD